MELLSDELVLVLVVAAVLAGVYLLRHIIAFTFKLIVFAGLVLALVWAWQHRSEIVEATAPYLGPIGERLGGLDLSDARNLLTDILSDEEPGAAETTGATGVIDALEEPGRRDLPGESERSVDPDGHESPSAIGELGGHGGPDAIGDPNDPDAPE